MRLVFFIYYSVSSNRYSVFFRLFAICNALNVALRIFFAKIQNHTIIMIIIKCFNKSFNFAKIIQLTFNLFHSRLSFH